MSDAKELFLNGIDSYLKRTNNFLIIDEYSFEKNAIQEDFFNKKVINRKYTDYEQYRLTNFSDESDFLENAICEFYKNSGYSVDSFSLIYGINKKEIGNNILSFNIEFYNDSYSGRRGSFFFTLDLDTMEQLGDIVISDNSTLQVMKSQRNLKMFCLEIFEKYIAHAENLAPVEIVNEMLNLNINEQTPEFKELMILKYDMCSYFKEDKELLKEKINKIKEETKKQIFILNEGLDKTNLIEEEYRKKIKSESLNENRKFNL